MRVLFIDAYFAPESIAFSHLENDLIDRLIADGHKVEVICPTPTRGVSREVRRRYRSVKREEHFGGRLRVRRFYAPRESKNPTLRALRYLWCGLREYQIGRRYRDVDAVFAVSTPPTQGLVAGLVSRRLGCRFVYSVQDIFPDSLVTTGLAKRGSAVWRLGRYIERKTYEFASTLVVISESCRRNLLAKGVDGKKLALVSNWVDVDEIKPVARSDNRLFAEFGIPTEKFIVVYAGNLGESQGADVVLRAAELLLDECDIEFVIFGGGSQFDSAVRYITERRLTNVAIHPLLPQSRVSEVYSLGDVALVTCKVGVSECGMPSKTWSILACNTPIIASFDLGSDLAALLRESGGGVCVAPGDAVALASAIRSLRDVGVGTTNGREYVKTHAEKKLCAAKYVDIICGKER